MQELAVQLAGVVLFSGIALWAFGVCMISGIKSFFQKLWHRPRHSKQKRRKIGEIYIDSFSDELLLYRLMTRLRKKYPKNAARGKRMVVEIHAEQIEVWKPKPKTKEA